MKLSELKTKPVAEIEHLVSVYPWFSYARKILLLQMSEKGEDYRKEALRTSCLYLYPERSIFREAYVSSSRSSLSADEPQVFELEYADGEPETVQEAEEESPGKSEGPEREIVVIGADYFTKEDFLELKKGEGGEVEEMRFELSSGEDARTETVQEDVSEFRDETFYTETLAKIYADQQLYGRAYEVYDKLILLYPEKSAYFATLKDEIKKKL